MNSLAISSTRGADRAVNIADVSITTDMQLLLRVENIEAISLNIKTNDTKLDNRLSCTVNGTVVANFSLAELDQLPNSNNYVLYHKSTDGTLTALVGGEFNVTGSKTLQSSADVGLQYSNGTNLRTISDDYNVSISDDYILANIISAVTLQLPESPVEGKAIHIKNLSPDSLDTITVKEGLNTIVAIASLGVATLFHDGSKWILW